MKIYLDVFFIVNFFMNLLVFEIMNIFLRKSLFVLHFTKRNSIYFYRNWFYNALNTII